MFTDNIKQFVDKFNKINNETLKTLNDIRYENKVMYNECYRKICSYLNDVADSLGDIQACILIPIGGILGIKDEEAKIVFNDKLAKEGGFSSGGSGSMKLVHDDDIKWAIYGSGGGYKQDCHNNTVYYFYMNFLDAKVLDDPSTKYSPLAIKSLVSHWKEAKVFIENGVKQRLSSMADEKNKEVSELYKINEMLKNFEV